MTYLCKEPETWSGKVVGTGHCVPFVQEAAGCPVTSQWNEGANVQETYTTIAAGTAIATFVDGAYENKKSGNHAAIFVAGDADGIDVWDQWLGQPVHKRRIRFRSEKWQGSASNNANKFSVIE